MWQVLTAVAAVAATIIAVVDKDGDIEINL